MDTLNAVNAAATEVVSGQTNPVNDGTTEVVSGQESAAPASVPAPEQTSDTKPTQTRAENSAAKAARLSFERENAELKRQLEALKKDTEKFKMASPAFASLGLRGDSVADVADSARAYSEGITVEELRLRDELKRKEVEDAVKTDPEYLRATTEAAALRKAQFDRQLSDDLAEIKRLFPQEQAETIVDLGDRYIALRKAGVDNLAAYAAINAVKQASQKPVPPDIGAVKNSDTNPEPDRFTNEEIDSMIKNGDKRLDDPDFLDKVIRSLHKK